jgi:ketosteroid isomerase-like protein
MSQENAKLARAMNEAARRGDWDAVAARLDPDVLIRTDPRWPEQRVYGREAVLDWYRGVKESMGSDYRIEEITDLGDRVLIRLRWLARGQHSDAEGDICYSELNTYRDGRMILSEFFLEHEHALKALGLTE